jgi:hypothetical protein
MTRCLIIAVDGTITAAHLATLEEFQRSVGGFIERLAFGLRFVGFVNEDGLSLDLEPNLRATHIWHSLNAGAQILIARSDRLVGPCIIAGREDANGNLTDVPPNFLGIP